MRETKVTSYIEYDSDRDRSDHYGWLPVRDEARPTESQQLLWSKITVVFAVVLAELGLLLS